MAKDVIGGLRVVLGLDSANFEAGARRAQTTTARLGASLAKLAAALATGAFAAFVKRSLDAVDAQAKLAQSFGTTVASIQVLERSGELAGVSLGQIEQAAGQLTRRLSQAAAGAGPAAKSLERLGLSAQELQSVPLDERLIKIQKAIEDTIPASERAAVAATLFGDRASLVFTRIDTATLRLAREELERFGVIVSEADADQIEATNDALSTLGLLGQGVGNQLAVAFAPALQSIAEGLAAILERTGPVGRAIAFLGDNIGRIATTAATFAAVLGARWAVGAAAAALATFRLAGALLALRAALIRTGFGALIVLLGEVVFQVTRAADAVGGFGRFFELASDVAREALGRIPAAFTLVVERGREAFNRLVQEISLLLSDALTAVVAFANDAANTMEGAVAAIGVIWGALPGVVGEAAVNAANAVIRSLDDLLGKAAAGINTFIAGINRVRALAGSEPIELLSTDGIIDELPNAFSGAAAKAGEEARAAFDAAFGDSPFEVPPALRQGLAEIGAAAVDAQVAARLAGDAAQGALTAPLASLDALRAAIAAAKAEADDPQAFAGAEAALEDLAESAGKAGGAARQAAEDVKEIGAEAEKAAGIGQDIVNGFGSAFSSAIRGADTLRGALGKLADQLADQFLQLAFRQGLNAFFPGLGSFAGFGAIPGNAVGDSNSSGGLRIVGERGKELVNLPRGAQVFDSNRTRSLLERPADMPAPQVNLQPRIVNLFDPSLVAQWAATPAGEQAIVNIIQRNRSALGA